MGKVSVLILVTLGAQVYAQGTIADTLAQRGASVVEYILPDQGLDLAVIAKPSAGVQSSKVQIDYKPVQRKTGNKFIAAPKNKPKRVFGGTNVKLDGNGMPCQEKSPNTPGYWGGGQKAPERPPLPKLILFNKGGAPKKKRVFGGTNKLLAGAGMPAQERAPPQAPYWGGPKKTGQLRSTGMKAQTDSTQAFRAMQAPGLQGAKSPIAAGRPLFR